MNINVLPRPLPMKFILLFLRMRSLISSMTSSTGKQGKGKGVEQPEAILGKFQQLRTEQRAIANKIAELEGDKNEHQ